MAHPNEDLVRESFVAFGRGDMAALQKTWAEDIRWHIPGRSPLPRDSQSIEQVTQGFALLAELTGGTASAELHDVLANDEHAVALVSTRAERAGKQLTDNLVQISHLRDGKASEVWTQSADQYASDEFYS